MESRPSLPYQRLPGTGYRQILPNWAILLLVFVIGVFALLLRGRRVQLWMSNDHLLQVEREGAKEFYKRIRFTDIQAFTIERTKDALATNVCLGIILWILLLIGLLMSDTAGVIVIAVIAAFFLILLIANISYGPSCRCFIRTAVQVEWIAALPRVRMARRAWSRIRPRVIEAQGSLSAGDISAALEGAGTRQRSGEIHAAAGITDEPPRIAT